MLEDDKDLDPLDYAASGSMPPPFQFEFAIFCPWATSVQVIIHMGSRSGAGLQADISEGRHILLELSRAEGSLWCGAIDLPGKRHLFSYRATAGHRTSVAPFEGGYHAPGTYAKVTARATYPGKKKSPHLCD